MRGLCCWLLLLLSSVAGARMLAPDDPGLYDAQLCVRAQHMMVNAVPGDFEIEVLYGESNGFHVIQMDADPDKVTIATTAGYVEVDGDRLMTHVGCKMVDRERISDVLGVELAATERSCRDINEATYDFSLTRLSGEQRSRYAQQGRKLRFADDYVTAGGAEWLPSKVDDYIVSDEKGITVTAPAVRVPWDPEERSFFQGTRHCKLITLAVMDRWVRKAAFTDTDELFPRAAEVCAEPHSMTSQAGSCSFWFAPAQTMFCQDYSGAEWDESAAREECGKRHASAEALAAANSKYAGSGGLYSRQSCAGRPDGAKPASTCVFHCRAGDETLWHTPAEAAAGAAGNDMMQRACDLYIER